MNVAVPFPSQQPSGYEWFDDEPVFDPRRHLQLEAPSDVVMLADFWYDDEEIATTATPVAISSPFRMLSDEGAAVLRDTARRLRIFARSAGDRVESAVRGGCYRSRWLRDLAVSPEVTEHLSTIYGTDVAPHPMPLHLGHLNYEPATIDTAIDKWHRDTLPLDYVLAVTDPATVQGGRFEYFVGTAHEAAELAAQGRRPPADRVVAPEFPAAGYAVALHGNMVVHRAGPLTAPGERISMVNGYVAMDPSCGDQSRTVDLLAVDDPEVLFAEWARFAAWRAGQRLEHLTESIEFGMDRDLVAIQLEEAVETVMSAARQMRETPSVTHHYEQ